MEGFLGARVCETGDGLTTRSTQHKLPPSSEMTPLLSSSLHYQYLEVERTQSFDCPFRLVLTEGS